MHRRAEGPHPLIRTREASEKEELEQLGSFAVKAALSAGRVRPEPPHAYRTDFQRDRDRVLHSRAFRRLEYKTQVFVHHEGDHYRNRLTHTLEGAQIARTVARALRLNEDLAEAIALAHDLGHTPFGHAGERALNEQMEGEGGFDHNRQSLRVVDLLEERYPGVPGLNLTAETREGILKHGCSWEHPLPLPFLSTQRSLEAQTANSADEISYIHHDLDDGLRSGILEESGLRDICLWRKACEVADELLGSRLQVSPAVRRSQILIALVNGLVTDLIEASAVNLESSKVRCVDDVRQQAAPLIAFSAARVSEVLALKRFLLERFYQHPRVRRMTLKAEGIVADLYRIYREDPELLPESVRARTLCAREDAGKDAREDAGKDTAESETEREGEARTVADYVAGMTDRFAVAEHRRLLDPHEPC